MFLFGRKSKLGAGETSAAGRVGESRAALKPGGVGERVFAGPHVIVGLGNPGVEYEDTRHNVGFMVIDAIADELGVPYWKSKCGALVAEVKYRQGSIILVKPQSFMNRSGSPVKALSKVYGFDLDSLLVVHDELDLPEGSMRLKVGGGHAGHNGLRSLHAAIGDGYNRLRIGIGRPPGRMPAHSYVLQKLKAANLEEFRVTVATAASMALKALDEGMIKAMNECNRTEH